VPNAYGAPVEPSRGNQRQSAASRAAAEWAKKKAESLVLGCRALPEPSNGKEGVDGSSPSEGFAELPANRAFGLSL
jgi:hypothetical protein